MNHFFQGQFDMFNTHGRLPEKTLCDLTKSMKEILEMKGQSFKGFMRKSFRSQFKELGCTLKVAVFFLLYCLFLIVQSLFVGEDTWMK